MKFSEIPILMYHEIRDQYDNMMCISQKEFSRQMGLLKRQNYKTISLARLKKGVENNEETNEKLVVITFDDGHLSDYTIVFPLLESLGIKFPPFPSCVSIFSAPFGCNEGENASPTPHSQTSSFTFSVGCLSHSPPKVV